MICGVDEAGKGPVIGPLVVAAVMVKNLKFIDDLGNTKEHLKMMLEVVKSEEIREPFIDEDSVHGI